MICTMLHGVRPVSLDVWRVERGVCFWPSWLRGLISSSTAATFSSAMRVLWSATLMPLVGASCFLNLFSKLPSFSIGHFVFESSVSIFREQYSLNCYKFLVIALSSLLNGTLHYQYIVPALKIIIYNNVVCYCLQTPEMHRKINATQLNYEN